MQKRASSHANSKTQSIAMLQRSETKSGKLLIDQAEITERWRNYISKPYEDPDMKVKPVNFDELSSSYDILYSELDFLNISRQNPKRDIH